MRPWCGPYGRTLSSPCNIDVVLSVLFAIISALVLFTQVKRLRVLQQRLETGQEKASWMHWSCTIIYGVTALSSFLWLIVSLVQHGPLLAGFQLFAEMLFVASWILVVVRLAFCKSSVQCDASSSSSSVLNTHHTD